jgi:hypothetical protein
MQCRSFAEVCAAVRLLSSPSVTAAETVPRLPTAGTVRSIWHYCCFGLRFEPLIVCTALHPFHSARTLPSAVVMTLVLWHCHVSAAEPSGANRAVHSTGGTARTSQSSPVLSLVPQGSTYDGFVGSALQARTTTPRRTTRRSPRHCSTTESSRRRRLRASSVRRSPIDPTAVSWRCAVQQCCSSRRWLCCHSSPRYALLSYTALGFAHLRCNRVV